MEIGGIDIILIFLIFVALPDVVTTKFTLAINCKADAAEPKPLS